MARIEEKIAEIANADLRQAIAEEVAKLKKRTRFGLVFEVHQPEVVPIHGARIKREARVALKTGNLADIWRVLSVKHGQVLCEKERGDERDDPVRDTFDENQLIVVRRMGEAIYPALTPIASVANGDPAQPHHILIEADNYHALQLMLFHYEGKVDCIYIDPPYNTGSRDWKYNNDYVDGNDTWRHSKWLSMMQRRLRLSKRLLNQADSVLIITIDEKEYLRLGLLLEQEFPDARIQMISSVINPSGSSRQGSFSRSDEYIYFVFIGDAEILPTSDDMLRPLDAVREVRWDGLSRRGATGRRTARPNLFYPIFLNASDGTFHSAGEALDISVNRGSIIAPDGSVALFPIGSNGTEMTWGLGRDKFLLNLENGYIKFGPWDPVNRRRTPYHIQAGTIAAVLSGEIEVVGRDNDGALILRAYEKRVRPMTTWNKPSHSAGDHGSSLLRRLLPGRAFPFPKSIYAVEDAMRFFVANKPDALIVDFFAGSGTTAHAVMRLNHLDDGHRQCISVTNNEVSADEQKSLGEQGLQPGNPDWEKWGICRHITFPRLTAAITGKTPDGEPIKGDYKFTDEFPMADGFTANLDYFRLDFLEPGEVQMGRQFAAILPLLWMMAGARGPRPEPPDAHAPWLLPTGCPFAVLMQETRFKDFLRHVEARDDLSHIFIVTNSADTVYKLRKEWPERRVVQLYKDYLENFRINLSEKPAP